MADSPIVSLSAITLATHNMGRSVAFYCALGFVKKYGGVGSQFTSFHCGDSYLNLITVAASKPIAWWGRVIFYVDDVDAMYLRVSKTNSLVQTEPRDAEWGERYFHALDPDGHELSFAKLI